MKVNYRHAALCLLMQDTEEIMQQKSHLLRARVTYMMTSYNEYIASQKCLRCAKDTKRLLPLPLMKY